MRIFFCRKLICAIGAFGLFLGFAQASINPLDSALNGGVVMYRGLYYAMSAQTNGVMLTSSDLVNWAFCAQVVEPSGCLEDDEYELLRQNGLFYLYNKSRGVCLSVKPEGPYTKWVRSQLTGDDLRLFEDSSGELFSLMRTTNRRHESEVRLQPCASPFQLKGMSRTVLSSMRGMWDSWDSASLGDPDVLSYRGLYYLIYGANHPSPRVGNRSFGVASAASLEGLNNESKRNEALLRRNIERLERNYRIILPTAESEEWRCRYRTQRPRKNWQLPKFEPKGWRSGKGGFGFPAEDRGLLLRGCRTKWQSPGIWVYRKFDIEDFSDEKVLLKIRHEGGAIVFLNGQKVYENREPLLSYIFVDITDKLVQPLRKGKNVLTAFVVKGSTGFRFFDVGLFGDSSGIFEPTVSSFSRPRVIEGPNGFEKWLAYQAYWDGALGSGLDRVLFHNKEMILDGPKTKLSKGYCRPPALPTVFDRFESTQLSDCWNIISGQWDIQKGALRAHSKGASRVLLNAMAASSYLFEADVSLPKEGEGMAGLIAYSDEKRQLFVLLDRKNRTWSYVLKSGETLVKKEFELPKSFRFFATNPLLNEEDAPFHRLRILKNGGIFDVELDGIRLTRRRSIRTTLKGPGRPGIYSAHASALFDGMSYTIGWDELGSAINGWGNAQDGTPVMGDWDLDERRGLQQRSKGAVAMAYKGDLLDCYEFAVNCSTERLQEGKDKFYGVFPVFADKKNYLRAVIDNENRELDVTGMLKGEPIEPFSVSLSRAIVRQHLFDPETDAEDQYNWVFKLPSESVISGLDVRWREGEYSFVDQDFELPNDAVHLKYAYIEEGERFDFDDSSKFMDADEPKPIAQHSSVFNPIGIKEAVGNYLALSCYERSTIIIDRDTGDYLRPYFGEDPDDLDEDEMIVGDIDVSGNKYNPKEVLAHVDLESSYFFRCIKLADRVLIELNGKMVAEISGAWPPSQVGLFSENVPCNFNGITLQHLPAKDK